jgi:hypothetical protein
MSIDDALGRIERTIGRKIEGLTRRKAAPREAMQIAEDVLDAVPLEMVPTAGETPTFPYGKVTVTLAVPEGKAVAARAVLEHAPDLRTRLHDRLLAARCAPEHLPEVALDVVEGPPPESWGGRDFALAYAPRKKARGAAVTEPAGPPHIRLQVLEGTTGERRTHALRLRTIRLGRTGSVGVGSRRTRRANDVAFDEEGPVNASVSRAHAHLDWSDAEGAYRLHDDGSTQGTRVLREGRSLEVPGAGGRGLALKSGDVLVLGRARVRFTS